MLAVRDDLRGKLVEIKRRFHDAAAHGIRLRLPQPGAVGHGAEQVIHMVHAPVDRRLHLLKRGV